MIHLSYNGELYSYDNKTTTTVTAVTSIPITIHPYVSIEGAKLYYKQNDTEGIVDITNNVTNIPGAYLVTGDLQVALKLASDEMSNSFTIGVTVINSSGDIMDDDIQFTMDNKKRLILVPGSQSILAIQFDNQSEIVTFKFPRYQEEVDLSTKIPYVNYKRPQVEDLGKALCTIEKTDDTFIYFSWMIDASATQYKGTIQFQVEFADSEGYRWQSQIGEIPILASLYNTGLEPYTPDILEQYLNMIREYAQEAAESAEQARQAAGAGLTPEIKAALLQLAEKVAYIDENGQDYYDDLYDALYPSVGLLSISAVYTQSGTVYDTDTLDNLKSDLVVTANYDDGSSSVVPSSDYTLSGTLTAGASTVSVSYSGESTTFVVTVTAAPTLSSITAVFTQGTAVIYNTDSLDDLEQYLTVTATWSDSSTSTVAPTDYTLSGTLSVGTSTITVSYGGKSDTFTVTVTAEPIVPTGYTQYDYLTTTDSTGDYISTGLTASGSFGGKSFSQLSCEVKMKITSSLAASINILGCRSTSSGTGSNGAFQLFGKADNTLQLYALGVDLTTSDTFTTNSATTVKYAANDNAMSTLTINNGTPNNVASLDFSTMTNNSRALVLYGTNRNGVFVVGSTATGVFQLGDVVFTDSNNQKVFEFIPVYSSADSKYGFYERVNEHFYPCNNGTLTGGNWS